jgi:hypothetical protein
MCTVQKATVLEKRGRTALVRVFPSESEREVECTRDVKVGESVEVFQNIII